MATGKDGCANNGSITLSEEHNGFYASTENGNKDYDAHLSPAEKQSRIKELRDLLCHLSGRSLQFCSNDCLRRFLIARHWNLKKAHKMLEETIKWRETYKPEEISWEKVEVESRTGKLYKASFLDKHGRSVLIMQPGKQNTSSQEGQIRQLVYFMENAIFNSPPGQEQMVWFIDFKGWGLSKTIPLSTARETAKVLQDHYPGRLAVAILYNPPKIFETFWALVKPFLDPRTYEKVKFVYTKRPDTLKTLQDLIEIEKLGISCGSEKKLDYDHDAYGKLMMEDDLKAEAYWKSLDSQQTPVACMVNHKVPGV